MNTIQIRRCLVLLVTVASLAQFSRVAIADDIENARRMCTVVDAMGAAFECAINASERAVEVTADTTQVDAEELCTAFSGMLAPLASMLSDKWTMRVFSTENTDTPRAACDLG